MDRDETTYSFDVPEAYTSEIPPWDQHEVCPPNWSDLADDDEPDSPFFRVLGHGRNGVVFVFVYETMMLHTITISAWSDTSLTVLAPLSWWEGRYLGKQSFKKPAVDWLYRLAHKRGFFDVSRIRGRGAWMDNNRVVFHYGAGLSVDGQHTTLRAIDSNFLYEQGRTLSLPASLPLSNQEGGAILELAQRFRWRNPASAYLLAGWTALAPICGALNWRPHLWITGGPGSGKTTLLRDFVRALLGETVLFANGQSTEAGIRQELQSDALPVLFDESEQTDERAFQRVQSVIALARQASSESGAKTLKGTAGHIGVSFLIRSMFLFSSVQVNLQHAADRDRFTVLSLRERQPRRLQEEAEKWGATRLILNNMAESDTALRLLTRTLWLLPTTLKNIEIFARVVGDHLGSQREGDQYGALLAGAWSLKSTRLATSEEVKEFLARYDWSTFVEQSSEHDPDRAIAALMESVIRLPHGNSATVHELVCRVLQVGAATIPLSVDEAHAELRRHGLAVFAPIDGALYPVLFVSNTAREVTKLIAGTPFAADFKGYLLRHPLARRHGQTVSLNGTNHRGVDISLEKVFAAACNPSVGQST